MTAETITVAERERRLEHWPAERLRRYAGNAKRHTAEQLTKLRASIVRFGFNRAIVVDDGTGTILAGHGSYEAGLSLGLTRFPVLIVDDLTEQERAAFVLADNRIQMETGWDDGILSEEFAKLAAEGFDLEVTGFSADELDELLPDLSALADLTGGEPTTAPAADDGGQPEGPEPEDVIPPPLAKPVTKRGDLWILGRHQVLCGDCTDPRSWSRMLGPEPSVDMILTDPPYCSGGFQEAGKSSGSIGARSDLKRDKAKKGITAEIQNDRLSTRGYQSLIRTMLQTLPAGMAYLFTDWRMWIPLYDTVEGAGFGVRSMIVWDKQTPGLGLGWRPQHELIMCGSKVKAFEREAGKGSVIRCKRTGNNHHPTEKPVELIETILAVTPNLIRIGEPFNGSGTTLIACEKTGRECYATELDAGFVDTTIRRWQALTGRDACLAGDGRTFAEIAAERNAGGF